MRAARGWPPACGYIRQTVESRLLRLVVVGQREGLHLLQGHVARAKGLHDARRHLRQLHAPPDGHGRFAETVPDLFGGHAVVFDQLAKRLHLVGGVHVLGLAASVFLMWRAL